MLSAIIERFAPPLYFDTDLTGVMADVLVTEELLKVHKPQLAAHFTKLEVPSTAPPPFCDPHPPLSLLASAPPRPLMLVIAEPHDTTRRHGAPRTCTDPYRRACCTPQIR